MEDNKERRKNQRFVMIEDVQAVMDDLKHGEVVLDISIAGARILSAGPKRIGEMFTFTMNPHNLGNLELKGKVIRSKIKKYGKKTLYETGIQFTDINEFDADTLRRFILFLERDQVLVEGRKKIKELLEATKKLKKNILVLKCKLNPPKEKDTTQ